MPLTMSDVALPSVLGGLDVLETLLNKAEAHAIERSLQPDSLLQCRLAADMFTFAQQIQTATDSARRGLQRLAEQEVVGKDDPPHTFEGLRERVQATKEEILALPKVRIDASTDRAFEVAFGPEMTVPFTGRTFLLSFLLPNSYFHITTAYNILRERGVAVGKLDYLGPLGSIFKAE